MKNWLLEFYCNRSGVFYLTVVADNYDDACRLGDNAAGNMGYSYKFSHNCTELTCQS